MRAVLDANVLFPTILREVLVDLAEAGLFTPLWSARILDEWHHAAARLGPEQHDVAGAEIALLRLRFPDALVADDGVRAIDRDFPDPNDRHVIEAALSGGAQVIVTANLRDFPPWLLAGFGLSAAHPDAFLLDLFHRHPAEIRAALESARARASRAGAPMSLAQMLKRCRLPRLARAEKVDRSCC